MDIFHGNCLSHMLFMADNSVDSIVTDPPYGLSFMGKKWDYDVPGVDIWAECLRVLKPGGHLLAFAGTRTQHRMAVRIEDAGFEIRDMIAWVYGSGFPKSHNGDWGGTALKPALEPVTMARKPLISTVAANVLAHGTGGLNIDECRVGDDVVSTHSRGKSESFPKRPGETTVAESGRTVDQRGGLDHAERVGRWPANLIHDGSDEVRATFPQAKGQQGDLTGHTKSRGNGIYGDMAPAHDALARIESDTSAARFFYCAKASKADREGGLDGAPDRVLAMSNQAKAELARGNMHEGESGMNTAKVRKNHHPTVKPTELMAYLVRLVTPPGGLVYDPFMGSGSTGKAALREGFRFAGSEMQADYVAIARARIAAAKLGGAA